MTTIVYRGGTMAADSRAISRAPLSLGKKVKIRRTSNGTLVGASSAAPGVCQLVMDWYCSHVESDEPREAKQLLNSVLNDSSLEFELLAVSPDGVGTYMTGHCLPATARADYYAIGSGDKMALGAFAMDASALQAVWAAIEHDAYSAGPVHFIKHDTALLYEQREKGGVFW